GRDHEVAALRRGTIRGPHQRCPRPEQRERQPGLLQGSIEVRRDAAGERDQPEGAHSREAAFLGLGALPLEPEQHAEAERDGEAERELEGVVAHRALSSPRSSRRAASRALRFAASIAGYWSPSPASVSTITA